MAKGGTSRNSLPKAIFPYTSEAVMKTIQADTERAISLAADRICALCEEKPALRIALGANDDCLALYRELSRRASAGEADLSKAAFFALDEFEGLPADDPRSCRMRLSEALLSAADPLLDRSHFLGPEEIDDYDRLLSEDGGLDLVVLGIGERGRIGFNEPGTLFSSAAHRQKLTKATVRELAPLFGGEEQVPAFGFTMGVRSILGAREILVIALGEQRADPVFRMMYARTDGFVPAAFLQLPLCAALYADAAAAAKL